MLGREKAQVFSLADYSSNSNRYEVPGDLMGLSAQRGGPQ